MSNLPIDLIVIHCSDSPHRGDTAEDIHSWHQERGWPGIGYHYVINDNGEIENGRPEYWSGAHVYGYNKNSLGVVLFGRTEFNDSQFTALRHLLLDLKSRHPNARILGHCDLDRKKSCPNFDVKKWCQEHGIASD